VGFTVGFLLSDAAPAATAAVASFILLVREGEGQLCDCVVQRLELRCHLVHFLLRGVVNASCELVVLLFLGDGRRGDLGDVLA